MLPAFRYHPDPIATGAIARSAKACQCCGEVRGFIYGGPFYAVDEIEALCPWCIANGLAAAKFDGSFVDDYNFAHETLAPEIVEQVCLRTPSYNAWQQEQWLTHCGDACAFHGEASVADVGNAASATLAAWRATHRLDDQTWRKIVSRYPNGNEVLFKFICLHCDITLFALDLS